MLDKSKAKNSQNQQVPASSSSSPSTSTQPILIHSFPPKSPQNQNNLNEDSNIHKNNKNNNNNNNISPTQVQLIPTPLNTQNYNNLISTPGEQAGGGGGNNSQIQNNINTAGQNIIPSHSLQKSSSLQIKNNNNINNNNNNNNRNSFGGSIPSQQIQQNQQQQQINLIVKKPQNNNGTANQQQLQQQQQQYQLQQQSQQNHHQFMNSVQQNQQGYLQLQLSPLLLGKGISQKSTAATPQTVTSFAYPSPAMFAQQQQQLQLNNDFTQNNNAKITSSLFKQTNQTQPLLYPVNTQIIQSNHIAIPIPNALSSAGNASKERISNQNVGVNKIKIDSIQNNINNGGQGQGGNIFLGSPLLQNIQPQRNNTNNNQSYNQNQPVDNTDIQIQKQNNIMKIQQNQGMMNLNMVMDSPHNNNNNKQGVVDNILQNKQKQKNKHRKLFEDKNQEEQRTTESKQSYIVHSDNQETCAQYMPSLVGKKSPFTNTAAGGQIGMLGNEMDEDQIKIIKNNNHSKFGYKPKVQIMMGIDQQTELNNNQQIQQNQEQEQQQQPHIKRESLLSQYQQIIPKYFENQSQFKEVNLLTSSLSSNSSSSNQQNSNFSKPPSSLFNPNNSRKQSKSTPSKSQNQISSNNQQNNPQIFYNNPLQQQQQQQHNQNYNHNRFSSLDNYQYFLDKQNIKSEVKEEDEEYDDDDDDEIDVDVNSSNEVSNQNDRKYNQNDIKQQQQQQYKNQQQIWGQQQQQQQQLKQNKGNKINLMQIKNLSYQSRDNDDDDYTESEQYNYYENNEQELDDDNDNNDPSKFNNNTNNNNQSNTQQQYDNYQSAAQFNNYFNSEISQNFNTKNNNINNEMDVYEISQESYEQQQNNINNNNNSDSNQQQNTLQNYNPNDEISNYIQNQNIQPLQEEDDDEQEEDYLSDYDEHRSAKNNSNNNNNNNNNNSNFKNNAHNNNYHNYSNQAKINNSNAQLIEMHEYAKKVNSSNRIYESNDKIHSLQQIYRENSKNSPNSLQPPLPFTSDKINMNKVKMQQQNQQLQLQQYQVNGSNPSSKTQLGSNISLGDDNDREYIHENNEEESHLTSFSNPKIHFNHKYNKLQPSQQQKQQQQQYHSCGNLTQKNNNNNNQKGILINPQTGKKMKSAMNSAIAMPIMSAMNGNSNSHSKKIKNNKNSQNNQISQQIHGVYQNYETTNINGQQEINQEQQQQYYQTNQVGNIIFTQQQQQSLQFNNYQSINGTNNIIINNNKSETQIGHITTINQIDIPLQHHINGQDDDEDDEIEEQMNDYSDHFNNSGMEKVESNDHNPQNNYQKQYDLTGGIGNNPSSYPNSKNSFQMNSEQKQIAKLIKFSSIDGTPQASQIGNTPQRQAGGGVININTFNNYNISPRLYENDTKITQSILFPPPSLPQQQQQQQQQYLNQLKNDKLFFEDQQDNMKQYLSNKQKEKQQLKKKYSDDAISINNHLSSNSPNSNANNINKQQSKKTKDEKGNKVKICMSTVLLDQSDDNNQFLQNTKQRVYSQQPYREDPQKKKMWVMNQVKKMQVDLRLANRLIEDINLYSHTKQVILEKLIQSVLSYQTLHLRLLKKDSNEVSIVQAAKNRTTQIIRSVSQLFTSTSNSNPSQQDIQLKKMQRMVGQTGGNNGNSNQQQQGISAVPANIAITTAAIATANTKTTSNDNQPTYDQEEFTQYEKDYINENISQYIDEKNHPSEDVKNIIHNKSSNSIIQFKDTTPMNNNSIQNFNLHFPAPSNNHIPTHHSNMHSHNQIHNIDQSSHIMPAFNSKNNHQLLGYNNIINNDKNMSINTTSSTQLQNLSHQALKVFQNNSYTNVINNYRPHQYNMYSDNTIPQNTINGTCSSSSNIQMLQTQSQQQQISIFQNKVKDKSNRMHSKNKSQMSIQSNQQLLQQQQQHSQQQLQSEQHQMQQTHQQQIQLESDQDILHNNRVSNNSSHNNTHSNNNNNNSIQQQQYGNENGHQSQRTKENNNNKYKRGNSKMDVSSISMSNDQNAVQSKLQNNYKNMIQSHLTNNERNGTIDYRQLPLSHSNHMTNPAHVQQQNQINPRDPSFSFNYQNANNVCPICNNKSETLQLVGLSQRCGHKFCLYCIRQYIENKIYSNDILKIRCPFKQCKYRLRSENFKPYISAELMQKYKHFKKLLIKRQNPNIRYCTRPECDGYIIGSEDHPKLSCPKCSQEICFLCCNNWHQGLRCDQALLEDQEEVQRDNGRQSCPKCKMKLNIFKQLDGIQFSNKIVCTACNKAFCNLCRRDCGQFHFAPWNICYGCPGQKYSLDEPQCCEKFCIFLWGVMKLMLYAFLSLLAFLVYPVVLACVSLFMPLIIYAYFKGQRLQYSGFKKYLLLFGLFLLGIILYPIWFIIAFVPGTCLFFKDMYLEKKLIADEIDQSQVNL